MASKSQTAIELLNQATQQFSTLKFENGSVRCEITRDGSVSVSLVALDAIFAMPADHALALANWLSEVLDDHPRPRQQRG